MPSAAVLAHLAAAVAALGLTTATLVLPKGGRRHRLLGRGAAISLVATALLSFLVPRLGAFSGLHVLSLVTLTTIPYGVWAIRHGRRGTHRRVMLANAAGLFGAAVAAVLMPGRVLHGVLHDAMPIVTAVLQLTPWPVFLLFGLLLWLGLQALKPRTVPVWRQLVLPTVFIVWGAASLAGLPTSSPVPVSTWAAAAGLGAALALALVSFETGRIDRRRGLVHLPGSPLPLLRNLTIFALKYGLAVAAGTALAERGTIAALDAAVSGASAGYFLGWLARLALAYRRTARSELRPAPQ
jgi:uncharacterized membrane protein